MTRGIFFDIHHTITKTRVGFAGLAREAADAAGLEINKITNKQLMDAIAGMNNWIRDYQIENEVDIHWGTRPEDWVEANRELLHVLGIKHVDDSTLIEMERAWKNITMSDWESLVDDAKEVLEELDRRNYILGVCTRRHDDPESLLKRWKIRKLFSTVQWTAVAGYAKPSPYTLIQAAYETGINPRLCAYVGNTVDADVKASMSAEMLPILTTWANPLERKLASENTIVVDSLSDLLDLFAG
jgi:phosphoglycolate phosphatase-like HAD superfamily hydrolase